jgi:hypothetical protein
VMRLGFYKRAQERSSQVPAEGGRTGIKEIR